MTRSGKIQKFKLAEMAKKEYGVTSIYFGFSDL